MRDRGDLGDDVMDVNVVINLSERLFRELKKHPDLVEELLMADICPRFSGLTSGGRDGGIRYLGLKNQWLGMGWRRTDTEETDSPQGVS